MIRGLAQRCPDPPMKTLVTYGAPSNGIFGVPDCLSATDSYALCELVRQILAAAAYDPDLQVLTLNILEQLEWDASYCKIMNCRL